MNDVRMSKKGNPIWRKSDRDYRSRAICIGLEPLAICFRLKGCRQVVRLPIGLADAIRDIITDAEERAEQ